MIKSESKLFSLLFMLIVIPLSLVKGERWDLTLKDGTYYYKLDHHWLVETTLFISFKDELKMIDVTQIDNIRQHREIKSFINLKKGMTYGQLSALGGGLIGLLVSAREEDKKKIITSVVSAAVVAGGTGFLAGGLLYRKKIKIVDYDVSRSSIGKKIRLINKLAADGK